MATVVIGATSHTSYERHPPAGGAPTDVSNATYTFTAGGTDVSVSINTANVTSVTQLRAGLAKVIQLAQSGVGGLTA